MNLSTQNKGDLTQFLNNVNGVNPNSTASIQLAVGNYRYKRIDLTVKAIAYQQATTTAAFATAPGGTPATFTVAVVAGAVSSVAIATAGAGQTPGNYVLNITDSTVGGGQGATASVTVAAGGTVTAAPVVTSAGVQSLTRPDLVIGNVTIYVSSINIADITAADWLNISYFKGYKPTLGLLPFQFVDPRTKILHQQEAMSLDMIAQTNFTLQLQIGNVTSPSITGVAVYDTNRNQTSTTDPKTGKVVTTPYNRVRHYHYVTQVVGVGMTNVTQFNWQNNPLERIYVRGSSPGNITEIEIIQDGNTVFQAYTADLNELLNQYAFVPYNATVTNQSGTITGPFDVAYVTDLDERWWKFLKCNNAFTFRVYSSASQNVTFIVESIPGIY